MPNNQRAAIFIWFNGGERERKKIVDILQNWAMEHLVQNNEYSVVIPDTFNPATGYLYQYENLVPYLSNQSFVEDVEVMYL